MEKTEKKDLTLTEAQNVATCLHMVAIMFGISQCLERGKAQLDHEAATEEAEFAAWLVNELNYSNNAKHKIADAMDECKETVADFVYKLMEKRTEYEIKKRKGAKQIDYRRKSKDHCSHRAGYEFN